jgi:hypothetical protein
MSKIDLPPLDLEPPRKRLDLKAIRPKEADDATVDKNSRRIGSEWGAVTSLARGKRAPLASLRIEVPEYLDRALALKAVETRVTKQYLVLSALRDAGFQIDDSDLVADKRRTRR